MIVKIENNQLKITSDNAAEIKDIKQFLNYNTRQYRHNDNSGLVIGFDINAIKLIEPKPAKPAYRVYKRKGDRSTYAQDRYNDGKLSYLNDPDRVIFMTDWIEYDPPKKWPTPLVERIAAVDIKAAQWIVDHWDDLTNSRYSQGVYCRESKRLNEMFSWDECDEYDWDRISDKLGE